MKIALMLAAAAVAATVSGMSAQACTPFIKGAPPKGAMPAKLPPDMLEHRPAAPGAGSIVGLWHVTHSDSSNNLYFESFDQWHSDGTEVELANIPPRYGQVCMGAWSQSGKDITLYHTTWFYDLKGNFVGTMQFRATNRMGKDGNSFSGTFDEKDYDPDGNFFNEVTGTTVGQRLVSTQ